MEWRNQNISNQCTHLDCPVYSGRSTRGVIGACPGNIPPHPRNELNHISLFTRIHVGIQPNLYFLEYLRSPRNDRPNVIFSLFSCGLFKKLLWYYCDITWALWCFKSPQPDCLFSRMGRLTTKTVAYTRTKYDSMSLNPCLLLSWWLSSKRLIFNLNGSLLTCLNHTEFRWMFNTSVSYHVMQQLFHIWLHLLCILPCILLLHKQFESWVLSPERQYYSSALHAPWKWIRRWLAFFLTQ